MRRSFLIIVLVLGLFVAGVDAQSEPDGLVLIGQSQYFDIYGHPNMDPYALLQKLDFREFSLQQALSKKPKDIHFAVQQTVDTIYEETSDILDIHIYSFHGKLKILPRAFSVQQAFKTLCGLDMKERSFYLFENNTIYISSEDLTLGMLGHEMAHAIISHYFVVPPSAKVQEVLAGYVDFHLRKRSNPPLPR